MAACTATQHGTSFAYLNRGCRCPDARAAMRPIWNHYNRARAKGDKPAGWSLHHDVDEVAVYRAIRGECLPLGAEERFLAVAQLNDNLSAAEIAARIGCSQRTVQRHRARLRQQPNPNRTERHIA